MLNRIQDFLSRRALSLRALVTDQRGATATEYGILVAFLAMALVIGVAAFGQALNLHYQNLATTLSSALGIP
ncbi:Flp family type IVb pilin [Pseudarthrobacter phenanthrenivorans]|jgi:pilus assembly protein Flp/PilA|uniref:Flp family type IVb pilin n=1 Tax=Pseudarthrobacter phenanthrenivorans TaxID=361575 RepID=UPI0009DD7B42|nr:Flp family type IVb pilin [Pseudarthrobacter phenanthrenivorans]